MGKIFCFKHANYDGTTPPDLSCRICCSTYIDQVTATQEKLRKKQGFNAYKWLSKKKKQDEERALVSGVTGDK